MSNFNKLDYDNYGNSSSNTSTTKKIDSKENGESNEKQKTKKQNIIRGVLVGLGGSVRSIVIPYLLVSQLLAPDGFIQTMIGDMLSGGEEGGEAVGQMFGTTGDIQSLLGYIIWLGIISVSIKWAKAYSPKRSGSIRREFLALAGTAIRIPGLYILILTGCSVLFLDLMGMAYMTIDLTLYIIVLMGFIVFRMVPQAYSLLESIVIYIRMDKEWEGEDIVETKEMEVSSATYGEESEDDEKTLKLDTPMDDIGYSSEEGY